MTFNLTIKITARDVTDASIGVVRVGLNVAQQVSQAPVKVNQMNLSTLFGQPLTIANLVALRIAIRVRANHSLMHPHRAPSRYMHSKRMKERLTFAVSWAARLFGEQRA